MRLALDHTQCVFHGVPSLIVVFYSKIEQNLDAITRTPHIHRDQLLLHTNRPVTTTLTYLKNENSVSEELMRLVAMYGNLDIMLDPYVVQLKLEGSPKLEKTILKHDTYSQKHIKGLRIAAELIEQEFGSWAAQQYLFSCVDKFLVSCRELTWLEGEESEKAYIFKVLSTLDYKVPEPEDLLLPAAMSPKLHRLIELLTVEMNDPISSGIVFVQTRAQVASLSTLLAMLPETRHLVRAVTFVGTSSNYNRKGKLSELVDASHNATAVEDLRSGRKNLIICTSACEEGIDISACNLVVAFEPPPNLKSFIQRRGRARAMSSKYILMYEDNGKYVKRLADLQMYEQAMEEEYRNKMRQRKELETLESEDEGYRELVVDSTG